MIRRDSSSARGLALLEVLLALTILGSIGIAALRLGIEASAAARRASRTDEEFRRADAFLNMAALWTRADLDRHLGWRTQGEWKMRVDHVTPGIYGIALADRTSGRVLLETEIYRPEEQPRTGGHAAR